MILESSDRDHLARTLHRERKTGISRLLANINIVNREQSITNTLPDDIRYFLNKSEQHIRVDLEFSLIPCSELALHLDSCWQWIEWVCRKVVHESLESIASLRHERRLCEHS